VLLAVCQALDIKSSGVPRIATAFGGGLGHQGEVCGAVSGGVMAIGLVYGRDNAEQKAAKEMAYQKAARFMRKFQSVNGNVRCRDLLALDIGTDEGLNMYRAQNKKGEVCMVAVSSAVRILVEMMEE
jgi:C_GCAxxG_C_C family probable redox protein